MAEARATSIDGKTFTFHASVDGLELQPGSYASLGESLGQVYTVDLLPGERGSVEGGGVLLEAGIAPFHDLPIGRADEERVGAWLESTRPKRAGLDVGELVSENGVRFLLDAGGFDRHTFFCGQSGSGKSYALGAVLEQLLLETSLRIVVLDPNSDFVRVGSLRDGVDGDVADRYRDATRGVAVRGGGEGAERLHVRFTDFDAEEQAAVLRLDPIRDREEYGVLVELVEQGLETDASSAAEIAERLLGASDPERRSLGARLRNLGIHRWPIWSTGDEGSVQDLSGAGGLRALVVDLGSLESPGEKAIAAESVLAALWRRRAERDPVLIVIDEAHNVCPREPADEVTALATERAAQIAAEGRKFGLYLLVSTQRPQRVNELVVSQCDNLVLMRMSSAADRAYLAETLSFAPGALVERAGDFRPGEALVAGKIASHPAFVRFGPRIAEEGGSDVPSSWADGS
ncbi:MAG TPA: ATP-binding protein [Gaiellaceae bacterium]|nr:ATP-binding protein [Gaiellaceae bacterium]